MPSIELARRDKRHQAGIARALTAPARGLKQLAQMVFGGSAGLVWRFMPRSRFDYEREVGDGMGSSLIMACVLWIARTFPEAPVRVLDGDGQPVDDHPLLKLLRRPNEFFSGIALWMATMISWVLDGNAYWMKIRNGAGNVIELWYVPHWMIEPVSDDPEKFITHYRYSVNGRQIRVEPSEVVHFRFGLDPRNPRKGLSSLGTLFREIFTDDEAANFSASLLRNLGVPGIIVSPEAGSPPPSVDDVQATKEYVDEEFSGDNRGKPMVMSGPTKVEQFGFSPEQMQVTQLRRVPEERVTAVLGLSAMVVGFGAGLERSTFNNYAEAREAAYESNIIPTQALMAEEVRHQLLIPDFEADDRMEFAFDLSEIRVLQEDRNKQAERLANLYDKGVISREEARTPLGMESTDADKVYKLAIAQQLIPSDDPETTRLLDDDDAKRRRGRKRREVKSSDLSDALIDALARDRDRLDPVLAQELELDLDELGRKAQDEFEQTAETKGAVGIEWTGGGLLVHKQGNGARPQSVKADDGSLIDSILGALKIDDWKDTKLKSRLEAHWTRTASMTIDTVNAVTELGLMLPDELQRKIFDEGGTRRGLIDIEQQTKDAIMRALADGREAGDGPIEIARRIREYVPAGKFVNAGSKYRAELIARTETLSAQRFSTLEAYKAAPNVTAVELRDGLLADSDAECEARDGDIVSFDEAESLMYDEHPLGTLSFSPIVGAAADVVAA